MQLTVHQQLKRHLLDPQRVGRASTIFPAVFEVGPRDAKLMDAMFRRFHSEIGARFDLPVAFHPTHLASWLRRHDELEGHGFSFAGGLLETRLSDEGWREARGSAEVD